PVSPELYGFATVASIVLLFLVGLETDIDIFRRFAAAGSGIGIGGVAASFVLGDLTAVLFSRDVFGVTMGFADPVPLFLGVISTATSVGISARILTEKRKIDSPEGVTILSAAIIDDVLGIVILAVVLGTIRSGELNLGQAAVIALRAGVVWMGFMVLGLVFSSRISRSLKHLGDKVAISVMGLALALLLAGIFEKSGLAMIIGAYVMGLTLSKTDLAFMIRDNLVVLYRFFIPVFFCVMGMLVNPGDILDRRILLFSLVYSAGAILAKLIGCGLPAFFFDFNRRGAARIGMGMVPRGEVAMIVAGIGLAEGILGQEAFAVAVVMTFVTTLVPPPFFARMFDSAAAGLRREISYKPEREHLSFSVPNPETADLLMDKILGAFRLEGFFIHRPDLRRQVFQVRKDSTFITVRQLPGRIEFDCRRE
ncbi:MAG TPA: cation:proton antiporter, partial [bacterium]|nr:cation:proton antiporter [bacterium]